VNRRPGYRCRHGHTSARPAGADSPRWVYWSQARLVEEVLAGGDSELTGCADAGQVAAYLRARNMLIVCSSDTVTLEDAEADDAEPECRAADDEGRPVDEVLGNGQVILPLPAAPARPKKGLGQRIPGPRLGKRDRPSRFTPECEGSLWGLTCPGEIFTR
jgi:hypothetical protein